MGETDTGDDKVGSEGGEADTTDKGSSAEDESQDSDGADGGEGNQDGESDDAKDGKDKSKDDAEEDDEDEDAPVRKPRTPADFVAMRRQKKIEKIEGKSKDKGSADEGEDDRDGDDEDLADEDARAIDRHLDKRLKPLLEKEAETELRGEIDTFVKDNPDFKDLAPKVEKWMKTPEWKNIPVDRVFYAVAGKNLLKIGAARKSIADKKAKDSKTGGGTSGNGGGGTKPVSQMTDAEFDAHVEQVKMGRAK